VLLDRVGDSGLIWVWAGVHRQECLCYLRQRSSIGVILNGLES
jgi:hypothetical protein